MRLLGIGRAPRFSPHSTARDAAILGAVAGVLRQQGHTVTLCNEDDLGTAVSRAMEKTRSAPAASPSSTPPGHSSRGVVGA
jgi:hypothetical protein